MGKPTKITSRESSSKLELSRVVKMERRNSYQSRRKTKTKIQNLFTKLRSDRNITIDSSANSTVILLDETPEYTTIPENSDASHTPKKNRSNLQPLHCSTPNSYIDLTETTQSKFNDVIDLEDPQNDTQDCTLVSVSNASLSLSGESDVTVIRNNNSKKMNKLVSGIDKMNASEKGRLLEFIAEKIFSGCKAPERIINKMNRTRQTTSLHSQTDSYIKEVILREKPSRNSIGSNIYNPGKSHKKGLRMVVVDGSNVAMSHGKGVFSVKALKICIDYFLQRGHVVKAFVPRFRCKYGKSSDPKLLDDLERRGLVVYTPSREVQGRMITSYDDRYIVQCAAEFDGVIVSGDNYRDLLQENPRWRFVIENRLLPFTWVQDMIMFPKDPLGRNGPTLDVFLRHPTE